jgi:hypothetical protein
LVVQLPRDCGDVLVPAATFCGTAVEFVALEHPDAAETNAKMIIVETMDKRRNIESLPFTTSSGRESQAPNL